MTAGQPQIDARRPFNLGPWRVVPDRNEIVAGEVVTRLEPMSMRLLCLLAANGERTTTRDEIVAGLWGGRVVTEDAISKQISKLRNALESGPEPLRLIQAVPKIGVRLLVAPTQPGAGSVRRTIMQRPLLAAALAILAAAGAAAAGLAWRTDAPPRYAQRPLTSTPGVEMDPALSPDGAWIAYAGKAPGETQSGLFVRLLAEDQPRRLTGAGESGLAPAWSQDGRLAFVLRREGGCVLVVATPLGDRRTVGPCVAAQSGGIAWRTADQLVVSDRSGLGRSFRLSNLNLRTGESRPLTHPPVGSLGDFFPVAAAGGEAIYFVRAMTVGPAEVHALDLKSGAVRQVSRDGARVFGLARGPRDSLVVSSDRVTGAPALWSLEPRRGRWRLLAPIAADRVSAAHDGGVIAFGQARIAASLWRAPLDGGPGGPLTDGAAVDWSPVLSPDRRSLAFLSNRTGSWEVWLSHPDGRAARRLTRLNGPAIQDLAWSPDGGAIVFSAPLAGQFDLHAVEVESGAVRRLTRTPTDERHGAYAPDGGKLYFSRREGGAYHLIAMTLAGGAETRLAEGVQRALPATDGRAIYFGRPFQAGLFRLTLAGGRIEPVAPWPDIVGSRNWVVAEGAIWGIRREGDAARLMRFDPGGETVTPGPRLDGLNRRSGLAVYGGAAVYTRLIREDSDLGLLRAEP